MAVQVAVPVQVDFGDNSSRICFDGAAGCAVLAMAVSIKIPLAALVDSLVEFQRKHEAPPAPPPLQTQQEPALFHSGGLYSPQYQQMLFDQHAAPAPARVTEKRVHFEVDEAKEEELDSNAQNRTALSHVPQCNLLEAASAPDESSSTPEPLTWRTLDHDKNYADYTEHNKWSSWTPSEGLNQPLWRMSDESCLVNFVPTPLPAPHFGRARTERVLSCFQERSAPLPQPLSQPPSSQPTPSHGTPQVPPPPRPPPRRRGAGRTKAEVQRECKHQ